MIHHREQDEVRRFDIFKLIILLILIALLLWFWLSPPAFVQGPDDAGEDTAVAVDTTSDTTDETAASPTTDEPAEDSVPEINVPVLEAPTLTGELEAGSVTLSGSGTPGSTVRVLLDGAEMGLADVDANGRWSLDVDLAEGSHTLSLEALDAAGTVATTVDFPAFEVTAPMPALEIPTLNMLQDDLLAGPVTLTGTGTPGSRVGVVIDGELAGMADIGADGTWSFETELDAGEHGLHVQAIDDAGEVAGESEGVGLSLGELVLPAFDVAGYEFTPGVVDFSGVGTPGSTVELVANGDVVGTAVVNSDGTWALPATLEAGSYDLSLRMLAADGSLLAESEGVTGTVAAAAEEEAVEAEFVLPVLNLPAADQTGGEITLTGSGTPGSEVEILVNGEVVGTAVVAEDGTWSFPTTLPAGDYELTLRTMDGSGTAVETDPASFSLAAVEAPASTTTEETTAATLPADFCKNAEPGIDQGSTYIVGVCEWLVKIANRLGIPYPDLIGVNPQIENPNLIYPGQVINLPPR